MKPGQLAVVALPAFNDEQVKLGGRRWRSSLIGTHAAPSRAARPTQSACA